MSDVHDYDTTTIKAADLDETHVLVGESGGLSAVYDNRGMLTVSSSMGLQRIETEHGTLFLDPDKEVEVLNDAPC